MSNSLAEKLAYVIKNNETKVRFLITGVLNSLFGLIMFPFFFYLLEEYKLHYLIILTISQFVCIIFAYLTNKFLVFKTKGNYIPEFLKFITFHLSHFGINLIALPILVLRQLVFGRMLVEMINNGMEKVIQQVLLVLVQMLLILVTITYILSLITDQQMRLPI